MTDLESASIAPGGAWAYIVRLRHGALIGALSQTTPAPAPLTGLIERADLVAWSRDGSYALLYDSSTRQLQRISVSGSAPTADPAVDLSLWGAAAALAIDPTGQRIAFAVAGAGLYFFTADQSPVLLAPLSQPSAIAFDETGSRLYVADPGQQQILEFDSSGGVLRFASLAQPDGLVLSPMGLAVSAGGRYLLAPDASSHAVSVFEIASQSLVNSIPLAFAPSRFQALSSGPSFLLNGDNPGESLLVLDATQTPSVYFVPAPGEPRQ